MRSVSSFASRRPFLAPMLVLALVAGPVACGGDGPTKSAPVASVSATLPPGFITAGSTYQITTTLKDGKGNVLTGRTVTYLSSNVAVATVSESGLINTLSSGLSTVTVTSEGQTATLQLTVLPAPVASVNITAPQPTMNQGTAQALQLSLRDARGNTLTGRSVAWSSSAANVATVTQTGVVNAIAVGQATITATSEGVSGTVNVTVQTPPPPVITSVTPSPMIPGQSATITGSNFEAGVFGNTVNVGGVNAQVTAASVTQITFNVPCLRTGNTSVRVTTGGRPSELSPGTVQGVTRNLAVGEHIILTSAVQSTCNELPAGNGRYLLMAFNVGTAVNGIAGVEMSGNPPQAGEVAPLVRTARVQADRVPTDAATEQMKRFDDVHHQHMERERQRLPELMRTARRTLTSQERAAMRDFRDVQVGDRRNIFFTFQGGCADVTRIMDSKVIYVGSKTIIWEDVANALQSADSPTLAEYYRRIGDIYEQDQHESVKRNFGDPLRRDAVTDGDGKVHMVFSQRLNGTGAAAYVTSCDQFAPAGSAAGSNFGQFFYGMVPTNLNLNVNSTSSPDGWFYFMARTVVHEVKHIASMSARVANNAPNYEEGWLEEGSARMAEEMWIRESLHKVSWKANTGWGTANSNGIYCDFHPSDATCNALDALRRPSYGMRRQFHEIRSKLVQPHNWSPYGDGTGQSGAVFYNTTWSLLRYAIDRFATSDEDFLTRLNQATIGGLNNILNVAGTNVDQLIGGWGLALYADDYPGMPALSNVTQFQTWNLRSIYAGLNGSPSWSGTYNTAFPIIPTSLNYGSFSTEVLNLRGGTHAYYEISGNAATPQLISLRSGTTGLLPELRLAILRLQ